MTIISFPGRQTTPRPGRRARRALAVAAVAAALLALGACTEPDAPDGRPAPTDPASYATALEEAVGSAREDLGLAPQVHDECAAAAAAARAKALAGAPELTHAPLDDVIATCAEGNRAAENLSRTERPPQEVVDAWLASTGHAANIKDRTLTRGAVACVQDGQRDDLPRFLCSHVMLGES